MNILVIEDEPIDAKLARVVLTFEGYTIHGASTAEEAFQVMEQHFPHLIVLDLALPGMNGLEFARQLKRNPETQGVPIIAVTAYRTRWPYRDVMQAGFDAFMFKPLNTRRLCEQVADIAQKFK